MGEQETEINIQKLNDPIYFLTEVLDLHLAPFHKEWIKLVEGNKKVVIQAPRGHGKTEVLMIGYIIYKAFTKPKFEGIIISKSMPQSTDILRRIKTHLRGSKLLSASIPQDRETSWSRTEIELTNGSRILCKPYSDAVRGFHVDFIGCDEGGTYDEQDTFKYAVSPTVNKKRGSIVVIGTPKSKVDLLHTLGKKEVWKAKTYKAITGYGKALWPEFFPMKFLKQIKEEQGKLIFSQEYLCDPLSSENKPFPFELISKGFLPDKTFIPEQRIGYTYFIGADFALSGAAGSDYTVFIVLEKDEDGYVRIVKMERYKGTPYEAQKSYLMDLVHNYQPLKVLLDEGTFGKTFLQELQTIGVSVDGYKFTYQSKNDLITHLINQFERYKIKIPTKEDGYTKEMMDVLINELLNFGIDYTRAGYPTFKGIAEHDDCVIALALAAFVALRYPVGILTRVSRTGFSKR